jgi:hypothetical protein
MLEFIKRIAADDVAVKLLFDHVRNIGICAVVFGAAFWKYKNIGPDHIFYLVDWIIVALLIVLGMFLFIVNQFHGITKLRQPQNPGWVIQLIMHT